VSSDSEYTERREGFKRLSRGVPLAQKDAFLSTDNSPLLSIRQENPVTSADWQERISNQPTASVFYNTAWAKVLSDSYGFTPIYFTALRGSELVSAIPLMEVDSWLTGKRGVSLPFTDECEPLDFEPGSSLLEEILRVGRTRKWKHVEFRGGEKNFKGALPSLTFLGHKLKLSADTDLLFDHLDSSVRRAIRKAENAELNVEFSQAPDAARDYYKLHCKTRKEHGLPPQPFRFFRSIHEHILARNLGVVVTATLRKQPVASAIYFHNGAEAVYKFGASDKTFQELRANNLVMWEAIKWLAGKGVKTLRFGRTSEANDGLHRYKLGWGTEEYRINYYKYDLRKNALITEKDAAAGWHNKIFRSLPMFLLRWTGSVLYKHVA
jgi:hypothetical protein